MLVSVKTARIVPGVLMRDTRGRRTGVKKGYWRTWLSRSLELAPAKSLFWLFLFVAASGCATHQQMLDQMQPTALGAAASRAQFELNCPNVTTSILSRKMIQPVWAGGIERAEYTIGVAGCDKRSVYMAVCPDSSNCNAFAQTGRVLDQMN